MTRRERALLRQAVEHRCAVARVQFHAGAWLALPPEIVEHWTPARITEYLIHGGPDGTAPRLDTVPRISGGKDR